LKEELVHIVQSCQKGDPDAQRTLYDKYSGLLMAISRRYMKNEHDAEDVLIEGFFKIFKNITSFKGMGSFEGWMKRIVVNEALMALRKKANFNLTVELDTVQIKEESVAQSKLEYEDIIQLLDLLPLGYRTVFNMYVIEGYKHREIAEILGISINTSKSQLILAKKRMRELLKKKNNYHKIGT
jgi:RNA polymerase sigma factor (sigma-70 family)